VPAGHSACTGLSTPDRYFCIPLPIFYQFWFNDDKLRGMLHPMIILRKYLFLMFGDKLWETLLKGISLSPEAREK
jgi:hypothetical protein